MMGVVGMTPSRCYVDVDDTHVRVRMGMWFELDTERSVVRSAEPDHERVLGWGVHGWRDRWLVNGSSSGIVRLTLDPSARAWMGPVPLRVRGVAGVGGGPRRPRGRAGYAVVKPATRRTGYAV